MIVHNEFQQGSGEWLNARSGIPTSSEFDNIVTPKFEARKGEMVSSYLAEKVAEKWIGGPLPKFSGFFDAEQGHILENEALPWYTLETGIPITRVGFITTDDGRIGASPDGIIGENSGIEVKCPHPKTHCKYLLAGGVPTEYLHQIHGSMLVTGAAVWTFLSYRRGFPNLIVNVPRDEEIQSKLREALSAFLERFDAAMKRMEEINGGPAPIKPVFTPSPDPIKFSWETQNEPTERFDILT